MIDIKISKESIAIASCIEVIIDNECGGIATFIGTIRNKTKGKNVVRLEYECYQTMALKEMKKIAEDAIHLFDVKNISMHHRIGMLEVGDVAVVIAINSPHREAAFDACRYAIDTLKQVVPIWKKEIFEDGEEWVSAHA